MFVAIWAEVDEAKRLASAVPAMFGVEHTKDVLKLCAGMVLYETAVLEGTKLGLEIEDPFPSIWTTRSFAKNELVLIPYTTNIAIVAKGDNADEGPRMRVSTNHDAVLRRSWTADRDSTGMMLVPYWHVYPTGDSCQANLVLKHMSVTRDQPYKVPYLTNENEIKAGPQLRVYK